jgi:hypothetical protein
MRSRSLLEDLLEEHLVGVFPEDALPVQNEVYVVAAEVRSVLGAAGQEGQAVAQANDGVGTAGSPRPDARSGLYSALWPHQQPLDVAAIVVGTDLHHDPGRRPYLCLDQSAFDPEDPLEGRICYLHLLPCTMLTGALDHQSESYTGKGLAQALASVGQITKQLPRQSLPEVRTAEHLTNQSGFRYVSDAHVVVDGHAIEIALHP